MKLYLILCLILLINCCLSRNCDEDPIACDVISTSLPETQAPTTTESTQRATIFWPDAFRPGNGYEYTVVFGVFSYRQAELGCRRLGGELITKGARNETTYEEVFKGIVRKGVAEVYIGLTDRANEGSFVWNDGVPVEEGWTNWHEGEPNDAGLGEDVVLGRLDGLWNDLPVRRFNGRKRQALCERVIPDAQI